jgi:hypothetical protein
MTTSTAEDNTDVFQREDEKIDGFVGPGVVVLFLVQPFTLSDAFLLANVIRKSEPLSGA